MNESPTAQSTEPTTRIMSNNVADHHRRLTRSSLDMRIVQDDNAATRSKHLVEEVEDITHGGFIALPRYRKLFETLRKLYRWIKIFLRLPGRRELVILLTKAYRGVGTLLSVSGRLELLAQFYRAKYRRRSNYNTQDMETALKYGREAVVGTPLGHPALPFRLSSLGVTYSDRYWIHRDLQDMEAAVKCGQAAVDGSPPEDYNFPLFQVNMASYYRDRYLRLGKIKDLEGALGSGQAAVASAPLGHSEIPRCLKIMALCYGDRHEQLGHIEDLEAGLKCIQTAVNSTPPGHLDLPIYQNTLVALYLDKYQILGNINDLELALKFGYIAINAISLGNPGLPVYQSNLSLVHYNRYQRLGDIKDLEVAISYGQLAVDNTSVENPRLPNYQRNLAICYSSRYHSQSHGNIQDLEAALTYSQAAVNTTPQESPSLPICQANLGIVYTDRYYASSNILDLEAAIHFGKAAIDNTSKENVNWPIYQGNLANAYTERYVRLGSIDDLNASLSHSEVAVSNTPFGHPILPHVQSHLSTSYYNRYQRLHKYEDLEASLKYGQLSVDSTPSGHIALPNYQINLAKSYRMMYGNAMTQGLEKQQCFEAALKYTQEGIRNTLPGNPSIPIYQAQLAGLYTDRYYQLGNIQDLAAALNYGQIAVNTIPPKHSRLPHLQRKLAVLYVDRYHKLENNGDLDAAFQLYKNATTSKLLVPLELWSIAIEWGHLARKYLLSDAPLAYRIAMNILPDVLWLGNSVSVRIDTISRRNIASDISFAITAAIILQQLSTAIEYLEQGLATIQKQLLQLKHEHIQLQTQLPQQALALQQLSQQLNRISQDDHTTDHSLDYHLLAQQRKELIEDIRTHQGFETFLLPLPYSKLSAAAQNGPVIMLNSTYRCDAIILLHPSLPPQHLALPKVSPDHVEKNLMDLCFALDKLSVQSRDGRHGRPHQAKASVSYQILDHIICWLWETIVGPVFELLKENGISRGRIWWCLSGLFTYLPIHAAAPLESMFIQSYTPTLEALIQANLKHKNPIDNSDAITAVGLVDIPISQGKWPRLPSISMELSKVSKIFVNEYTQLKDSDATVTHVINQIKSSAWLHLACHGQQDRSDPLKSGLILYDGKLELGQILDINLPLAKFVYLSACETAMGDGRVMNEAMHLTGGFIAAGFQGAIGTLWSMSDATGPVVAEVVYQTIFQNGNKPDVTLAAEGLHIAVQRLRKGGAPPHQWMPFIHMGI